MTDDLVAARADRGREARVAEPGWRPTATPPVPPHEEVDVGQCQARPQDPLDAGQGRRGSRAGSAHPPLRGGVQDEGEVVGSHPGFVPVAARATPTDSAFLRGRAARYAPGLSIEQLQS